MRVTVNGKDIETYRTTLAGLIEELGVRPGAVEVNLEIIKKSDYSTFRIKEGDKIEIVQFVGGG